MPLAVKGTGAARGSTTSNEQVSVFAGFSADFEALLREFLNPDWRRRISSAQALRSARVSRIAVGKRVAYFVKRKVRSGSSLKDILSRPLERRFDVS